MDETNKKVHPLKKILAVVIVAITAILCAYFVRSCNQTISSITAEDLIGCTYFSKENNYIVNFYTESTMNYVNSKEDEFLLLNYEFKENVVLASCEEVDMTFVIVDQSTILYQQLNKFLFLME